MAYDDKGNELCRDVQRSFGDAAALFLAPDKTELKADGSDMIFVEISALDANGTFVADANNRVKVEVSGAGRLVGLDNGDSTDYDSYKGISRRLFGAVEISPEEFTAPCPFSYENKPCANDFDIPDDEIPIRRIDITGDEKNFAAERRELTFGLKILPENATQRDIVMRVTNVVGITSNLAVIKSFDENSVTVECCGDGEFYLRAQAKNGTDKFHVISAVKLTASGLGKAFSDPYSMIMGGLFSLGEGRVTHGIQQGVNLRDGAWCGFEKVDFGSIGSDTVTLPIFANYATPVRFQIWDGTPENGELLGDFEYSKKPVWLTYQEETYKLKKTLRGIHTISLKTEFCLDIQGFVFERRQKESAELFAANAENIYGDRFTVGEDAVTGIGNNVNICFGSFDFTEKAPESFVIKGRSKLISNSINLLYKNEDGSEVRVLAEFAGTEDYTERSFSAEGIKGRGTVELVFLPGSDIDLMSLRFE